jgi:hypothetical protein|nr:MAG TPA: hypothetical protein [Bacteriophage sp.]
MNKLINFLKTTAYTVAIIISICLVFMVAVISTAQASEQTTEREQARIQWIAEHGQYQPNLTEPAKQEALAYTEQKQKELDYEKVKNRN